MYYSYDTFAGNAGKSKISPYLNPLIPSIVNSASIGNVGAAT
jgi:hypothetical protein